MVLFRTEPCPDCKNTTFAEWRSEGDLTCTRCGLVVEQHMIDERSEWRTFSDKDKDSSDPNRVGGPSNPLLQGLTTTIGRERGDKGVSFMLNRVHARANNADKPLTDAFKEIAAMCEALGIMGRAKDAANKIYKEIIYDQQALKGRSTKAICAACVVLGCRDGGVTRTFKEICAGLSDIPKKDIAKSLKAMQRAIQGGSVVLADQKGEAEQQQAYKEDAVQKPRDIVRAFGHQLRLEFKVVRGAEDICDAITQSSMRGLNAWDGRTPTTIAAAVLYISMTLAENRKNGNADKVDTKTKRAAIDAVLGQVVLVSKVAEGTVRGVYREMHPELANIVPKQVATAEELARMPVPPATKDTKAAKDPAADAGAGAGGADAAVKAEPGAGAAVKAEPVVKAEPAV